jgi:hypothetical protein
MEFESFRLTGGDRNAGRIYRPDPGHDGGGVFIICHPSNIGVAD